MVLVSIEEFLGATHSAHGSILHTASCQKPACLKARIGAAQLMGEVAGDVELVAAARRHVADDPGDRGEVPMF